MKRELFALICPSNVTSYALIGWNVTSYFINHLHGSTVRTPPVPVQLAAPHNGVTTSGLHHFVVPSTPLLLGSQFCVGLLLSALTCRGQPKLSFSVSALLLALITRVSSGPSCRTEVDFWPYTEHPLEHDHFSGFFEPSFHLLPWYFWHFRFSW